MARLALVPLASTLIAITLVTACTERPRDPTAAAPAPSRTAPFPGVRPESLVALAESSYFRAEYDSARAMLQEAIRRAPADSALQARALTWIGLAALRQGDYDTAHTIGERALSLKLRRRLTADLFRS